MKDLTREAVEFMAKVVGSGVKLDRRRLAQALIEAWDMNAKQAQWNQGAALATIKDLRKQLQEAREGADTENMLADKVSSEYKATQQSNTYRKALEGLVNKLEEIHDNADYKRVWEIAYTHIGSYQGPNYAAELDIARQSLQKEGE